MVQVKKKAVRDAIVSSASRLFSRHGYSATTLSHIAEDAGLGVANIYSYFPSKLHLLYEVYRPWFLRYLLALAASVRAEPTARTQLRRLIVGLWQDLPASNPRLANSLMEALASSENTGGKPNDLLAWSEAQITEMLREILPAKSEHWLTNHRLAHLLMMAQDGFVINHRWGENADVESLADALCDVLLRTAEKKTLSAPSGRQKRPARSSAR